MIEFEKSVRAIEGVTQVELKSLPVWLIERLDETFHAPEQGYSSDAERVDWHLGGDWLGHWGSATLGGKDVYAFEYCAIDSQSLFEPAELAEMLYCGLEVAEPCQQFEVDTIAVLTEHRRLLPRRKSESKALAHN